jgi:hypothetical protein
MYEFKLIEFRRATNNPSRVAIANAGPRLNALGSEGWRLVSVDGGIAYLQREIMSGY